MCEHPALAHPPPQDDRTPRDLLDPEPPVVREPAVERVLERAGDPTEVGVPGGRIARRLLRREPEQKRVAAASLHPASERRRPGLLARVHPFDEDVREAALDQVVGQPANEALRERVAREAAVAVRELRLGRDHVGRVRDDQVEALALDRLEEAARPDLDVRAPVQGRVEARERDRARVHVGRDHVLVMMRGEQRVDAVAGADVERVDARPSGRERGKPRRCRREGRDEADGVVGAAREAVEREQQVLDRQDSRARPQRAALLRDEPGRE